jgi:hypothetical protein
MIFGMVASHAVISPSVSNHSNAFPRDPKRSSFCNHREKFYGS